MIVNSSETRLNVLGSSCHITVDNSKGHGERLLTLATEELARLEKKFSSFQPASIVSSINQCAGTGSYTPLDAESLSLFNYVSALWRESKHLFDPSTRILEDCYDDKGHLLASKDQLQGMLKLVGWSRLEIANEGARLQEKGMLIDLNSCIRPYAIDSVRKIMLNHEIKHALIEMDQDMATIGKRPDGANWLVGVRRPSRSRTAIARIKLNDSGLSIRGDFERSVIHQGERFGRALSPIDGQSIPGLLGVAVLADTCLTACSAASVARLKTEAAAMQWLESLGYPWFAIDRSMNCHGPLAF